MLSRELEVSGLVGSAIIGPEGDQHQGRIVDEDNEGTRLRGSSRMESGLAAGSGEEGLCARCAEQRNALTTRERPGVGLSPDIIPTAHNTAPARRTSPSASAPVPIVTSNPNPNPNSSPNSNQADYPSFVPPSYFSPGMIQSIPSTSSTAYTQILTPVARHGDGAVAIAEPIIVDTDEIADGEQTQPSKYPYNPTPSPPPVIHNARVEEPVRYTHRAGPSTIPTRQSYTEHLPNPLLDIGRLRRPSQGRGTLYPGSIFRGKQTSGRSSYEVEVRILDVDFPMSTLSGYLSISHLTDTHPKLTTFFSGEIVGEQYGFLTGTRYYAQATEQDDLRHWSRFDRFHQVRNELRRPGLTMSEKERVIPSSSDTAAAGPTERERPFVFMRWKERFLVPDHKVRDISGASFAGFYYLQLELEDPAPVPVGLGAGGPSSAGRKSETVYLNGRPGARGAGGRRTSSSGMGDVGPMRRFGMPFVPPGFEPPGSTPVVGASTDRAEAPRSTLPTPPPGFAPATTAPQANATTTTNTTTATNGARPSVGDRTRSGRKSERDVYTGSGVPVLKGYYFHHQNSEPYVAPHLIRA